MNLSLLRTLADEGDVVRIVGLQTKTADATVGWGGVFLGHLIFAE